MPETPFVHNGNNPDDQHTAFVVGDDYLWGFVQGTLDPAESLVVATQCHMSPRARHYMTALAECAATSLEQAEPKQMRCSAQAFFEEKCTGPCDEKSEEIKKEKCRTIPPRPLQEFVGNSYTTIQWKPIFPNIGEKRLTIRGSDLSSAMVKMDKGAAAPLHSHRGDAMVLVLCGSFSDNGHVYRAGDVIFYSEDIAAQHRPQALEDGCILLAVMHAPIRIHGFLRDIFYRFFYPVRSF